MHDTQDQDTGHQETGHQHTGDQHTAQAPRRLLEQLPVLGLASLAVQLVEQQLAQAFRGFELTPNEGRVLVTLHLLGPARTGVVSALTGLRASTFTNVSRRLLDAGQLTTSHDPSGDGRTRQLQLTDRGRETAARLLTEAVPALESHVLAVLGADEVDTLRELLSRVLDHLLEQEQDPSPPRAVGPPDTGSRSARETC